MESNHLHNDFDRLFYLLMITTTILSILPKDQTQIWHNRHLCLLYFITIYYILMRCIDLRISKIENIE